MRACLGLAATLILASCIAVSSGAKSLPSSWKVCKRADPKLGECLRDAVNIAIADLSANGAREFGVYPIDPLMISAVDIDQGTGPVAIELHFKDLHIEGLKNARVGPVVTDFDHYRFTTSTNLIPEISLRGFYRVSGKVLILPITGEGRCELKLSNVRADISLEGKPMKKDGVQYMNATDFKFTFTTENLKMDYENLFSGNKQLGEEMNIFLNDNWPEILKELQPAIQDAFGAAFAEVSRRIFRKVPFNKIFL